MKTTACSRNRLIEKMKDLNLYGPISMAGKELMLYHGQTLVLPDDKEFSTNQIRFLIKEVESIVSKDEWNF